MRIISFREVPISYAIYILKTVLEGRSMNEIQMRVIEYGEKMSKCDAEASEKLFQELVKKGFKEITASQIVNIAPETYDELRILLNFEEKGLDEKEAEEILRMIKEYCREAG